MRDGYCVIYQNKKNEKEKKKKRIKRKKTKSKKKRKGGGGGDGGTVCVEMREGGERSSSFSLRSIEIGWLDLVGLRSKVYLLDEGYAWI